MKSSHTEKSSSYSRGLMTIVFLRFHYPFLCHTAIPHPEPLFQVLRPLYYLNRWLHTNNTPKTQEEHQVQGEVWALWDNLNTSKIFFGRRLRNPGARIPPLPAQGFVAAEFSKLRPLWGMICRGGTTLAKKSARDPNLDGRSPRNPKPAIKS